MAWIYAYVMTMPCYGCWNSHGHARLAHKNSFLNSDVGALASGSCLAPLFLPVTSPVGIPHFLWATFLNPTFGPVLATSSTGSSSGSQGWSTPSCTTGGDGLSPSPGWCAGHFGLGPGWCYGLGPGSCSSHSALGWPHCSACCTWLPLGLPLLHCWSCDCPGCLLFSWLGPSC